MKAIKRRGRRKEGKVKAAANTRTGGARHLQEGQGVEDAHFTRRKEKDVRGKRVRPDGLIYQLSFCHALPGRLQNLVGI